MGCDFRWNGSIPDATLQTKAIELYRSFFDPMKRWPEVTPQLLDALAADGRAPTYDQQYWTGEARNVPRSPFPLRGIVPYLRATEDFRLWGRGQFVCDLSDGGKLVSVREPDRHAEAAADQSTGPECVNLRVQSGGYLRLVHHETCTGLALFLNVLALRYVPNLEVVDGRHYYKHVREEMTRRGWIDRALDETQPIAPLVFDVVWKFVNPDVNEPRIELSSEEAWLQPIPRVHDFVPSPADRFQRHHRLDPKQPAMVEECALSALEYVARSTGAVVSLDESTLELTVKLNSALSRVWERDGFSEIASVAIADRLVLHVLVTADEGAVSCTLLIDRVIDRIRRDQ